MSGRPGLAGIIQMAREMLSLRRISGELIMNIESANLSSLPPSIAPVAGVGVVEGMSQPLPDGVVSEGFSGALVAQLELLNKIKTGDTAPLQTPDPAVNSLPVVTDLSVGSSDVQDFAALLGNDLPSTYKTKDDVDHEAALGAVTDVLKYITLGTTAGEKAAEAEKNIKDVIAMATPVQQNIEGTNAAVVPVLENKTYAVAVSEAVPAQQNMTAAETVPTQQNMAAAEAEKGIKNIVGMGVPERTDLKQVNDKPSRAQIGEEAQTAEEGDDHVAEGLVAAVIPHPIIMSVEQGKSVSNLTPADVIDEVSGNGLLSYIKSSIVGSAKSDQSAKVVDDTLQGEAVFRQPVQEKPGFNLKYAEDIGKGENVKGRLVPTLAGEKTLPGGAGDISQLNRPVIDHKTEVPAMTKPLSHPEWNKDLGERIVWMNNRAIPAAEIRLNPQHLGPISVRVDVADDQATVVFTAQHAAVREVLEASIPKLREMMSAQQINLVDVNVYQGGHSSDSGRSQAQNFAQGFADSQRQGGAGAAADGVDNVEQEIESGRAVVSKGLLSIYA